MVSRGDLPAPRKATVEDEFIDEDPLGLYPKLYFRVTPDVFERCWIVNSESPHIVQCRIRGFVVSDWIDEFPSDKLITQLLLLAG